MPFIKGRRSTVAPHRAAGRNKAPLRRGFPLWVWKAGIGIYAPDGKLTAIEGFVRDVSCNRP